MYWYNVHPTDNSHRFGDYSHFFSQFETDAQPWQVSTPIRNSENQQDFVELCRVFDYEGYIADAMINVRDSVRKNNVKFKEEIMLYNPKEVLTVLT